jgi:FG-GAP-like repeat
MKQIHFSALACSLLCASFLPSAFANHRTGTLILPELLVAGDFNEDGNFDIAVNATGFDNMAILLGDGHGQFTLTGHVASDTLPKGLAVGDVNRDGHVDLVQCNNWGYNAIVHFGDGLGGFGEHDVVVNGEGGPNRVVLADFNNDRALDMAVAGPDEGVILIYLDDGKGGFILPPREIEDIPNDHELIAADFNGDGKVDIATTASEKIGVFLGDGTGSFTMSADLDSSPNAAALGTGDANKDGKLDLFVAGAGPNNNSVNFISTYLGDGAGSFVLKQTIDLGRGDLRGEIAVGDFDEDGNADVAFPLDRVLMFFGDGTGNLVEGAPLGVGDTPHTVITTDFNKDGHQDLAVSNRGDGTVSVLLGDGNGKFTTSATVSILCPTCLEE